MYSAFGHDLCIVFKNCGYEMQFSDKFCEIKKLNMPGTFANNELLLMKVFQIVPKEFYRKQLLRIPRSVFVRYLDP